MSDEKNIINDTSLNEAENVSEEIVEEAVII